MYAVRLGQLELFLEVDRSHASASCYQGSPLTPRQSHGARLISSLLTECLSSSLRIVERGPARVDGMYWPRCQRCADNPSILAAGRPGGLVRAW